MKNLHDLHARGSQPSFDRHIAIAELLLRNSRDLRAVGLNRHHYDCLLLLKALGPAESRTAVALASRLRVDPSRCQATLDELRQRRLVCLRRISANLPGTLCLTRRGEAVLLRLLRKDQNRWLRLGPSLLAALSTITKEDANDTHDSMC